MSSLEKYVQKIHKKLNNESLEERKVKKYLKELDGLQISLDILKATGIGRAVNRYRKHSESGIGELASSLVTKWKDLLKQESGLGKQCSSSGSDNKNVFHLNNNLRNHKQSNVGGTLLACETEMQDTNHKDVKPRHKTGEINETKSKMRSAPQLCDVSFGCEPVIEKSKKRPLSTTASAAPSIRLTSSDSVRPELGLPPLPSSLSVHNSLLPEIQPTYKPIRTPDFGADTSPRKKKGIIGSELDANALTSRKSRTQVFSGRKIASSERGITSLFELAMKVLIENIDALDDTGGVPYEILLPVLERCNPQQLLHLEECNPYFIDDTEPLWEKHCFRDFKGTKPKHNQSWRELYMKNELDKEERLKKIHEKITASQRAKKPERQVQLAYVTTEAKPPRDVRRKQAKFGTGTGVHPCGPPVSGGNAQVNHRNMGSSPAKKLAVPAPMMKKTMQLFKNQRNRAHTSIKRT